MNAKIEKKIYRILTTNQQTRIKAIARQIIRLDGIPTREALEIAAEQIRADERADAFYADCNPYDYALGADGRFE